MPTNTLPTTQHPMIEAAVACGGIGGNCPDSAINNPPDVARATPALATPLNFEHSPDGSVKFTGSLPQKQYKLSPPSSPIGSGESQCPVAGSYHRARKWTSPVAADRARHRNRWRTAASAKPQTVPCAFASAAPRRTSARAVTPPSRPHGLYSPTP